MKKKILVLSLLAISSGSLLGADLGDSPDGTQIVITFPSGAKEFVDGQVEASGDVTFDTDPATLGGTANGADVALLLAQKDQVLARLRAEHASTPDIHAGTALAVQEARYMKTLAAQGAAVADGDTSAETLQILRDILSQKQTS